MDVAIRTNGGAKIGLGHIRRCLTLAQALSQMGAGLRFILNDDPVALELVRGRGFEALSVRPGNEPEQTVALLRRRGADVLLVDSYELDGGYFAALGSQVGLLAAIDDLADRHLPVDLIANGSVYAAGLRYSALPRTRLLLGPEYMLLRREFAQEPGREFREQVGRILVTLGGSDPWRLTPLLARLVIEALGSAALDVVIGPFFTNAEEIEALAGQQADVRLHHDPQDMRGLMLGADLAITGGGQTTYELAATGTPAIAICLADNQRLNLESWAKAGALLFAGQAGERDLGAKVSSALGLLAANPGQRRQMSRAGRSLVDGLGAQRVAGAIVEEYRRKVGLRR